MAPSLREVRLASYRPRASADVVTVKTGRWGGVVTAFITMSDIKDEIDWEFPGKETTQGQSNYFWQGVIRTFPAPRPRPRRVAHSTHPRVCYKQPSRPRARRTAT